MKVSARLLTLLAPLAPLAWLLLAAGPPPQEAPAPAPPQAAKPRVVALDRDDIVVKESVIFAPPATAIPDRNGNGVIRIEADGVTVDFGGALLLGSAGDVEPDGYAGFGIRVEGRKDVTIRNATIVGFKVGIYARECTNLRILDCNVTRNFRQRLKSTPEREDLSDWLWPHVNDDNEWMEKYGAAIYLDRCTGATVARCTGRDQQNGIILSRTTGSFVHDNDFSFHSGWGLALWRSSGNEVASNRFDWCVRGYSHGVYHRGQDSAGILVFEQSSDNVFAYNSATHGGDGFFLYAGHETTKETGKGGCNRNLVYGNDFSHAVANGIEATFSRDNVFAANVLDECDYGIWAGYSYESRFLANKISRSLTAGIAIEHGHDNTIALNTFEEDRRGVWLWWDEDEEFLQGPFGREQDTDSHRLDIRQNDFHRTPIGVLLERTREVTIRGNEFHGCPEEVVERDCREVERVEKALESRATIDPPETRGRQLAFLPKDAVRGREAILVDGWGPVRPDEARLIPGKTHGRARAVIRVVGPPGVFRARLVEGVARPRPRMGEVPGRIEITGGKAGIFPFRVEVAVAGGALEAEGSLFVAPWRVRHWTWDSQGAGKPPADWNAVIEGEPVATAEAEGIDLVWGGGGPEGAPADHFATVAEAEVPLEAGRYEFRTVSDDGVRLRVDDDLVIDHWTWHAPTEDVATVRLAGGTHRLRLEHFEIDGHSQLSLFVRRLPDEE